MDLARWLAAYKASKRVLQGQISTEREKACKLLRLYHIYARILLEVSLWPDDESIFDSQTDLFILLLKRDEAIRGCLVRHLPSGSSGGGCGYVPRSIVDIGWIQPIFLHGGEVPRPPTPVASHQASGVLPAQRRDLGQQHRDLYRPKGDEDRGRRDTTGNTTQRTASLLESSPAARPLIAHFAEIK